MVNNFSVKNGVSRLSELNSWPFEDEYAPGRDHFPKEALEGLRSAGLMSASVPLKHGGLGWGHNADNYKLLKLLRRIGSYDLSLGRIYEGHINALLLIESYGSEEQKDRYFREAKEGKLFGVWNSELPSEKLMIRQLDEWYYLKGAKVFCSGASYCDRPVVTTTTPEGKLMIVLHMEEVNLEEDYTYWQPLGMIASVSCRFDFTNETIHQTQILGTLNDYEREPDFSGGAVRFCAVQLGGAEAAINAAVSHLSKLNRIGNVNQIARLGKLSILLERGRLWLKNAGTLADNKLQEPKLYVHCANMIRIELRSICEEVLSLTELSVGLQGLMKPHPLERIHRDLSVYLKQPGPDHTLSEVGKFFSKRHSR